MESSVSARIDFTHFIVTNELSEKVISTIDQAAEATLYDAGGRLYNLDLKKLLESVKSPTPNIPRSISLQGIFLLPMFLEKLEELETTQETYTILYEDGARLGSFLSAEDAISGIARAFPDKHLTDESLEELAQDLGLKLEVEREKISFPSSYANFVERLDELISQKTPPSALIHLGSSFAQLLIHLEEKICCYENLDAKVRVTLKRIRAAISSNDELRGNVDAAALLSKIEQALSNHKQHRRPNTTILSKIQQLGERETLPIPNILFFLAGVYIGYRGKTQLSVFDYKKVLSLHEYIENTIRTMVLILDPRKIHNALPALKANLETEDGELKRRWKLLIQSYERFCADPNILITPLMEALLEIVNERRDKQMSVIDLLADIAHVDAYSPQAVETISRIVKDNPQYSDYALELLNKLYQDLVSRSDHTIDGDKDPILKGAICSVQREIDELSALGQKTGEFDAVLRRKARARPNPEPTRAFANLANDERQRTQRRPRVHPSGVVHA